MRGAGPASSACRCAGSRSAPRTRRPPSRAAARSRTSSSPPTPTASSPPCGCELLADMGAYLQLVTPGIPLLGAFLYAGVYDLPAAYSFACTGVFTTMTPTDAYRGAGRPGGHLRHRAGHGRAGREDRASTRSSCAGATSSAPSSSRTPRAAGLVLRLRRPRRRARQGARAGRLRRRCAPSSATPDVARCDASTSASACRPTSRCAASPRRGCWPR